MFKEVSSWIDGCPVDAHLVMEVGIRAFPCISYVGDPLILQDSLSHLHVDLRQVSVMCGDPLPMV